MTNPLISKLENFAKLSADEKQALQRLVSARPLKTRAHEDIIREGEDPKSITVVLQGWACRYKQLEDGRRQIVSFFLPGDVCDTNVFILREMDHSISALTNVTFAQISSASFEELVASYPRLSYGMWWETLVNMAVQREWTVNLGQRSAFERLAHLFCELFLRLRAVGMAQPNSFILPIRQHDIADATGLSSVHVNRTLQELRALKLIVLKGKVLTIPDLDALMQAAMFNPNYLHLDNEGRNLDSNERDQPETAG